jgi:small subunit ribosomal protein S20
MAITSSAKKALRQSQRKRAHNRIKKDETKKILKEFVSLVSQKKAKEAKELLPKVYKAIDKAEKIGLMKKNTASRKKSRMAKLVAGLK